MRALIAFAFAFAFAFAGCATTTAEILDRIDAESDAQIERAVDSTVKVLRNRRESIAIRKAAALALGRLRSTAAATSLGELLNDPSEPTELQAYAGWALGELRSEASLAPLLTSLRGRLEGEAGDRVLEAIAKHDALLARDPNRFVELVEAMVFWAGRRNEAVPALYDLLDERARTIPVGVQVVLRALAAAKSGNVDQQAAVYQAAFELAARLEQSRPEITAAGAEWAPRVEAAVGALTQAIDHGDPATVLLGLWSLGRIGDLREVGAPAADALVGPRGERTPRPTRSPSPAVRLVAAWALGRMQLHGLGARRALLLDLISREATPEVLRVVGDLTSRADDQDLIQKLLDLEAR